MREMTPRETLDAIHEGLLETSLLVALGWDPWVGRPGRILLNNSLERRGFGRPIEENGPDGLYPYRAYPDAWIKAIACAVAGREDAPLREVICKLRLAESHDSE